jgi:hypothetical protein
VGCAMKIVIFQKLFVENRPTGTKNTDEHHLLGTGN